MKGRLKIEIYADHKGKKKNKQMKAGGWGWVGPEWGVNTPCVSQAKLALRFIIYGSNVRNSEEDGAMRRESETERTRDSRVNLFDGAALVGMGAIR